MSKLIEENYASRGRIIVIHKRDEEAYESRGWKIVRVHRPFHLGNPFSIPKHGDRELVIKLFREWIYATPTTALQRRAHAALQKVALIAAHQPTALVCFCSPCSCHADVIRDIVIKLNSEIPE